MRLGSFIAALVLASLLDGPAVARTELLKTQLGSLVHWAKAEITVGIDPSSRSRSLSPEKSAFTVRRAAELWNRVPAGQPRLRFVDEGPADVSIRFRLAYWHGEPMDLGNTQFSASTQDGAVARAVILLNERDHVFFPPGEPARGGASLQGVVAHELGHVLGLGHSDDPATVMYPSGGGTSVYKPNLADATALALIYLGRSSGETSAPAAAAVLRASDVGPAVSSAIGSRPGIAVSPPQAQLDLAKRSEVKEESPSPPTDSVSVLTLTASRGRQVLLYTCEPTLLPPIAMAPAGKEAKRPHIQPRRQASGN